ncbi:hypothetical protein [Nocardia jinanensis]|uniref:Uncharacterized protein n=1 Tax=Nocardia jinanensis TaxID=382504 RepID=A0A917RMG2_9NOCA|nr:hypothetical protein [Nocardia jinanensis]GGL14606.1 hypothetical protein GCM10011588_31410 [Nocardia jinanensis]
MTSMELRLAELRAELATGERTLAELDQRREQLVTSMLRISGAVQVLEELAGAGRETAESEVPSEPEPVGAVSRE